MKLTFEDADSLDDLAEWLSAYEWPFHGKVRLGPADVRSLFERLHFTGEHVECFWARARPNDDAPVALIRLFDLEDPTPLFDLRVATPRRRRGFGTAVLRWATKHVFEAHPQAIRFCGYTRVDNVAMRRTFEACGFVKEAHHRRAWRCADGSFVDCVGYAVLRSDWASGTTTPVAWDG